LLIKEAPVAHVNGASSFKEYSILV
jgi:hypothetical protein